MWRGCRKGETSNKQSKHCFLSLKETSVLRRTKPYFSDCGEHEIHLILFPSPQMQWKTPSSNLQHYWCLNSSWCGINWPITFDPEGRRLIYSCRESGPQLWGVMLVLVAPCGEGERAAAAMCCAQKGLLVQKPFKVFSLHKPVLSAWMAARCDIPGRCAVVPSAMNLPGAAVANRDMGPPALVTAGSVLHRVCLASVLWFLQHPVAVLAWLPGGVNMPYIFTSWRER